MAWHGRDGTHHAFCRAPGARHEAALQTRVLIGTDDWPNIQNWPTTRMQHLWIVYWHGPAGLVGLAAGLTEQGPQL